MRILRRFNAFAPDGFKEGLIISPGPIPRSSGIDTKSTKIAVFAISGFLAAWASILYCARLEAADPNAGAGLELQVIAAAVIGGASPLGGHGSVVKSFLGVLILAVLNYGLAQIGASEPTKRIIIGSAIIASVALDLYRNRPSGHPRLDM